LERLIIPYVILLSNVLLGLSLFLFGFSSTPLLLLVFIVLFSLGELLIGARLDTLVDEMATPETKGSYFGCSELIRAGVITGPIVGTWLLGQYGLSADALRLVYSLLGLITLLGSGLIMLAQRGYRKGRVRG
jgi:MFS family permease